MNTEDYEKFNCFDKEKPNSLLTWEELKGNNVSNFEFGNKGTIPIPPSPEQRLIHNFRIMMQTSEVSKPGTLQPEVHGSKYDSVRDCLEHFFQKTEDTVMSYGLWDYRTSYFARIDGINIIVHVTSGLNQWFYLTPDEIEKYVIDIDINSFPNIKEFMKPKN